MKIKYIITALLFSVSATITSQVKIGATTAPNSFSALEIENIGKGLRLPQLTTAERDALTGVIEASANVELAGGLVIYNESNKILEMWRDATEKWIPLPSRQRCTAARAITVNALSSLTLDEYGAQDLVLEAVVTGSSSNADLYYEWFLNGKQVGDGKIYTIPKERLSFKEAGAYTVRVISCSNKSSVESKISASVTVTINEI